MLKVMESHGIWRAQKSMNPVHFHPDIREALLNDHNGGKHFS